MPVAEKIPDIVRGRSSCEAVDLNGADTGDSMTLAFLFTREMDWLAQEMRSWQHPTG
jgi:hypothetical protein